MRTNSVCAARAGVAMVMGMRCGGRLRLIALSEDAAVVGWILRHLGVATEVPAPPFAAEAPRQAGWDDDVPVFTPVLAASTVNGRGADFDPATLHE